MTPLILNVTDASLQADVLHPPGLLLLDFWADWCAPCKALAPLLDEIAVDYADGLRVGKVDADQNPACMARFGVRSLPTLILFANGEEVERSVGISNKTRLAALVEKHMEAS